MHELSSSVVTIAKCPTLCFRFLFVLSYTKTNSLSSPICVGEGVELEVEVEGAHEVRRGGLGEVMGVRRMAGRSVLSSPSH